MITPIDITKEDVQTYENVRRLGNVKMYVLKEVIEATKLTKEKIYEIMKNYPALMRKHLGITIKFL